MNRSRWLVAAIGALGALALGCGTGSSETSETTASLGCADGSLDSSATHVDLEHDGQVRSYEIHVPPAYDGETPFPLVLSFHGLTSTGLLQQESTQMDATADREGFVVVYPNGIDNRWNFGASGFDGEVDDVGFARAVVEDLGVRGCFDTSRVYATGMSNGGFFTHRLACDAADIFAAAAPVAAVFAEDSDCAPSRPMPIMMFNGTEDSLIPYDGGGQSDRPSVPETTAAWLSRNGCAGEPVVTYQNGDVTCETTDACSEGSSVTLCTIEGGGHCWPGQPCRIELLGPSTTDIDANEAMWELFRRTELQP